MTPDTTGWVADWVASRLTETTRFKDGQALGIFGAGGQLLAGVVYHGWRPQTGNIEASVAAVSPRWARRGVLRAVFHYPFEQLECRRVTAIVADHNERSRRFLEGIGFVQEGVMREGSIGGDAIIYGLLRSEAERWLKAEVGDGRQVS